MRLAVIDTETTGFGPKDQVVELATVLLDERGVELERVSTLARPTVPISLEARAVHHILDAELENAPPTAELLSGPAADLLCRADVLVGHNLEFDVRMLTQSGWPSSQLPSKRLCTYRCGVKMFPDSPRHTNQVLRYYLNLDVSLPTDMPPHRALPDALVTAAILRRMLREVRITGLVQQTSLPVIQTRVPMGKYRGMLWSEMDVGFLRWVLGREFSEEIKDTAKHWLEQKR